VTSLRKKMEADLRLRNLAPGTRDHYIRSVARFAQHFGRSPDLLGAPEVRDFLLHLADLGRAAATRVVYHAALRFLYTQTLGRPEVMATVPRPRVGPQKLRNPLVKQEVEALFEVAIWTPFTYTLLATLLATGLRISEVCALRMEDIDATAGLLHVRRGKGAKPRSVQLGDTHLHLLRRYWKIESPGRTWLFPAQRMSAPGRIDRTNRWADHPVATDTIRARLHAITRSAGVKRTVTPHDFRRTYATWLLEDGVDLRVVQVLLGHASPETTCRYTQVRPELIRRTPSPLDMI